MIGFDPTTCARKDFLSVLCVSVLNPIFPRAEPVLGPRFARTGGCPRESFVPNAVRLT